MRIVIKEAGKNPEVREIPNELHVFQEIVGGYIEAFQVLDNVLCICDEEGKFKDYMPNFIFNGDIIVGTVFFCAAGNEDFESLNDDQIEMIVTLLSLFELRKREN